MNKLDFQSKIEHTQRFWEATVRPIEKERRRINVKNAQAYLID
jgi:hypothetical protein